MAVPGSNQLSEADRAAAVQAFEALGICTQLAEAAAALGWKSPTSIQEQAVPNVLAGESRACDPFPIFPYSYSRPPTSTKQTKT